MVETRVQLGTVVRSLIEDRRAKWKIGGKKCTMLHSILAGGEL